MTMSFPFKLAVPVLSVLILVCSSCTEKEQSNADKTIKTQPAQAQPQAKPAPAEAKPDQKPAANVVATIGDEVIIGEELRNKIISKYRPMPMEFRKKLPPADPRSVVEEMLADKAMAIEGRKLGYLQEENIIRSLKEFKERKLITLLLEKELLPRVTVTNEQIDAKIQSDPNLDRSKAEAVIKREQANKLVANFYNETREKLHLKKLTENLPKVVDIHQRLLLHPKEERRMVYIKESQVAKELTQEEKDLVLATFDGGKVTLLDWFNDLLMSSPPSRPKDLDTVAGVERVLDGAIWTPVMVTEAKARGLENDPDLIKQVRDREDNYLTGKYQQEKTQGIEDVNDDAALKAFFDKRNNDYWMTENITINQIWCADLKTAKEVKAKMEKGEDPNSLRAEYSLEKDGKPGVIGHGNEGRFFLELWNAEPNQIVGPVKGFYKDDIKWRVVKILAKTTGDEKREYNPSKNNFLKMKIREETREEMLAQARKDLLAKYPHKIYTERLKKYDPMNID